MAFGADQFVSTSYLQPTPSLINGVWSTSSAILPTPTTDLATQMLQTLTGSGGMVGTGAAPVSASAGESAFPWLPFLGVAALAWIFLRR